MHAYALDPPSTLPASSIPVIQDLVCVRLVQSGQHAAAIKLDRQFASIARGGDKAQKAAHDRHDVSAASISHGGGPGTSVNELYFPASVFFGKVRALPKPEEVKYPSPRVFHSEPV